MGKNICAIVFLQSKPKKTKESKKGIAIGNGPFMGKHKAKGVA